MSAKIEMEWSDAKWDDGVAEELVDLMTDALAHAGRVLPDLISATVETEEGETAA
jgi:hypothetical protein